MQFKKVLFTLFISSLLLESCQKSLIAPAGKPVAQQVAVNSKMQNIAAVQTFNEGFEAASKTAYATADVTFNSGSWSLDDALVGTSTSDAKTGNHSVRIRNTGTLSMNFDVSTGASTVTMSYAVYGSDGPSAF